MSQSEKGEEGVLSLTNEKLNLKDNKKNPTYLRLDACGHLHTLADVEKMLPQDGWSSGLAYCIRYVAFLPTNSCFC